MLYPGSQQCLLRCHILINIKRDSPSVELSQLPCPVPVVVPRCLACLVVLPWSVKATSSFLVYLCPISQTCYNSCTQKIAETGPLDTRMHSPTEQNHARQVPK
jgi:hypothetical protein